MTVEKITKKQMYEAMIKLIKTGEAVYPAETMAEFCEKQIELLEKKADKAKERNAAKQTEKDALTEAVEAVLTEEFQTIADIAPQIDIEDATRSKITYRLGVLVKAEIAEKAEVVVEADGKKRKVMGYKLITH